MRTWFLIVLLLVVCLSSSAQNPAPVQDPAPARREAPSLPVVDLNACPFEGCTFGKWTVIKKSVLYTSWKADRVAAGNLSKGEPVVAITGVHVTWKPDRIRVVQEIPDLGLKPGNVILRYMYQGEGFANIWANGKYMDSADCSFITEKSGDGCSRNCKAVVEEDGVKEWWAQVQSSSGKTGWTLVNDNFSGMDSLAVAPSPTANSGN